MFPCKYYVRKLVLAGFLKLVPSRTHKMVVDALWKKLAIPSFCRAPRDHNWSCFFWRSSTTLRRRIILSADFDRCAFTYFFRLIVYIFFWPSTLRPGVLSCLWLFLSHFLLYVFLCFHNSFFFGLPNTVSLRSHYCTWGRAIKRPRTRSAAARQVSDAHEQYLVTNQNV